MSKSKKFYIPNGIDFAEVNQQRVLNDFLTELKSVKKKMKVNFILPKIEKTMLGKIYAKSILSFSPGSAEMEVSYDWFTRQLIVIKLADGEELVKIETNINPPEFAIPQAALIYSTIAWEK